MPKICATGVQVQYPELFSTPEGMRSPPLSYGNSATEKVSEPSTLKPRPQNTARCGLKAKIQDGEQNGMEGWVETRGHATTPGGPLSRKAGKSLQVYNV